MINEIPVRKYCKEFTKIENYGKAIRDTTQVWACHHRLETHNSEGERRIVDITVEELKALGMYWNRPPEELIFLTKAGHIQLHRKGKKHSEEWVRHQSEALKDKLRGKPSPKKGKKLPEETRRKISESMKGKHRKHSEEELRKMSKARKGKHWKPVDGRRVWY